MYEFVQLVKAVYNILRDLSESKQVDFSNLRISCQNYNQRCSGEIIYMGGSDRQLLESVTSYLQSLS